MPYRSLLVPPSPAQYAEFVKGFGPRVLLTVDTEEEFDWSEPFRRSDHGLSHLIKIPSFQKFCEGIGIAPVYLVDWVVACSPVAEEVLGEAVRSGRAEIGIQLHPWINPPHDEDLTPTNSFPGSLPPQLEREKFVRLAELIEKRFGTQPQIYRAGRYGLGPETARMLSENGIAIDSSVRSSYDYSHEGGPDYRRHPAVPYWSDQDRQLLELPLTTVFWGMLRKQGRQLFQLASKFPFAGGTLSRLGLLERISLTPEGVTKEEALRGVDIALDDGLPLLVISLHSPSLQPGHTPYVRTPEELDDLYDWLRGVFAYLELRGVRPTTVREIIDSVVV